MSTHTMPTLRAPSTVLRLSQKRCLLHFQSRLSSTSAAQTKVKEMKESQPPSQTAQVETARKRFWKSVSIKTLSSGDFHVELDHRPLKTPEKATLCIPKTKLTTATLIAREWDEQKKILLPSSLPMTSLVARAIDGLSTPQQRSTVVNDLMKFLDTDTILFHESSRRSLVQLQNQHWIPLMKWANDTFRVNVEVVQSLLSIKARRDDDVTKLTLKRVIEQYDQWTLAAFERCVHSTKSFIISLALIEGHLSIDEAADASRVEVLSQIARWGEVEDTHDVDHHDIRSRLGSAACLLFETPTPSST